MEHVTVLAVIAAAVGIPLGMATHRFNQRVIALEEQATAPPLPAERFWAPALDALLLGLLFWRHGASSRSLVGTVAVVVLVQVLVFDARHRLILNRVMYPAAALALLIAPFSPLIDGAGMTWSGRLLSAVIGALVAGGLFFLLSVATGGVGMGDVKLCFFLGALLGGLPLPVPGILSALAVGMVGGGVAAALLLVTRVRRMGDVIPFGPFLCAGGLVQVILPCALFSPIC